MTMAACFVPQVNPSKKKATLRPSGERALAPSKPFKIFFFFVKKQKTIFYDVYKNTFLFL